MLGYLILLFTIVPIIELAVLIKAGQYIGTFYTIALVILTGVVGALLAKLQGLLVLKDIEREVNRGVMPADKLFDGVIILCSGLLLLTPGFITDALGFVGLIPFSRSLLKQFLKRKIADTIQRGRVIHISSLHFRG
jgi:UPF0716 protein FxsA